MRILARSSRALAPLMALSAALGAGGCVRGVAAAVAPHATPIAAAASATPPVFADPAPCDDCAPAPLPEELREVIETRLESLRERGGRCAEYGAVLERSYRDGRITLRPYMWRVNGRLAAAMARGDGRITLARHIDSLNVGVRTPDDLARSLEHEAVHIAFQIPSRSWLHEEYTDSFVHACRAPVPSTSTTTAASRAPNR